MPSPWLALALSVVLPVLGFAANWGRTEAHDAAQDRRLDVCERRMDEVSAAQSTSREAVAELRAEVRAEVRALGSKIDNLTSLIQGDRVTRR